MASKLDPPLQVSRMNQFFVQVVMKTEKECVIQCISADKTAWYLLPEDLINLSFHKILVSRKPIYKAALAIKNKNDDIKENYFDDAGNVCFKEFPLEECIPLSTSKTV